MTELLEKDRNFIWHPYTQHKTAMQPFEVVWAEGSFLYTANGKSLFDAISSWWVLLHGHCHPYLIAKVQEQFSRLEQVLFAGFTHQPAVLLAERVLSLLPSQFSKVFYSDNGSTSVEIALKMCIQYWHNQGKSRKRILAFRHAYHGDTFAAMSVSERSMFTNPFSEFLFPVDFIDPPLRKSERGQSLQQMEAALSKEEYAAFIFEPLVQGSHGMLMQDADELSQLIQYAQEHNVLCIADEVMTGFGRTGKLFASEFLTCQPDIMCLAKGLTGGTMPLAMTICKEKIFEGFLSENKEHALYHGHSFTANPIACAASLASLDLLMKKECIDARKRIAENHSNFCKTIGEDTQAKHWFKDLRQQGTILAMEWNSSEQTGYTNKLRDEMYSYFIERGQLLRPLGNVLYILPPYCATAQDLEQTYSTIMDFGRSHFGSVQSSDAWKEV